MIPELGHLCLFLALGLALAQAAVCIIGAARDRADWMVMARTLAFSAPTVIEASTQGMVTSSLLATRLPLVERPRRRPTIERSMSVIASSPD